MESTSNNLRFSGPVSAFDFSQTTSSNLPSIPYNEIESKPSTNHYELKCVVPWVHFQRNGSTNETRNKFHVSIKKTSSNFEKAFSVIFPILEKYQIAYFKIIPLTYVEAIGNPVGKEYTIYIQDVGGSKEAEPNFWSNHVLKEIVENLEKEGIEPGEFPTADIAVKGSKNFIYTRAPHNFFDNYIYASFLQKLEFSREESAHLSPSSWVNLAIDGYAETEAISNKQPLTILKILPDVKSEAERIYMKFVDLLVFEAREINVCAPALYFLVAGMTTGSRLGESNEVKMLKFLFEKKIRTDKEWGKDPIYLVAMYCWLDLKIAPLEIYLKKAAFLTAYIQASQNEFPLENIGNIHPAIYHSFLVPLAKKFENEVDENFSGLFDYDEERQLISYIATCALRKQYPEFNGVDLVDLVDYVACVDKVDLDIHYRQESDDDEPSWDGT